MKKTTLRFVLLWFLAVLAYGVSFSPEQIERWKIQTKPLETVESYPLARTTIEVVAPPARLEAITLPFEANVQTLRTALFDRVQKGQTLAVVTGTEWINAQRQAIAEAIEYRHHKHLTERKMRLCKEGIIPKKECRAAQAELQTDLIRMEASKALLKSFGANEAIVANIYQTLQIANALPIKAPSDGVVVEQNAYPGKSIAPSSALFVIRKDGAVWVQTALSATATSRLKEGDRIMLQTTNKRYGAKVLRISESVDAKTQTRLVRLALEGGALLPIGTKTSATLLIQAPALRIPRKGVVKLGDEHVVFVRSAEGLTSIPVAILAEDERYYYLQANEALRTKQVALTGLGVLKNMAEQGDE